MKPSLPSFISLLLVMFTFSYGDLKANPECTSITASIESEYSLDDLLLPDLNNSCYPPDWHYSYGITQTSATWSWGSCYGAYSYTVQWRYPGGYWYNLPVCYQTWVNVINLSPCTTYEWRVRANCSYGYYSSWCYPDIFTTLCNYCEVPYGCYTDNIQEHCATFHWAGIYGADSYDIQILWPGGSWTYANSSPCYNTYFTACNLQPGTYYQWRVRAHCGYNYSNWTYNVYFTTPQYSCHYPAWLQCYNITGYSGTWQWAGVYDADYYHVQWCYPGGTWYDYAGGYCHNTWVNVNNLNPCTTYKYRVRSYCHYGGWSDWCYPHTFTTTCHYNNACPVPSGLITKDIGDTKATFKWSPVSGAHSYSVQIKDAWGYWQDVPGSPTSGIWITAYNLTPCKTYEWRIKANCDYYSYSSWSQPKSFTTTCGHGCYAPEWVYTNGITPSTAVMHWGPVIGADYYVVEWQTSGGTWTEMPGGPWTNNLAEVSGLQSNTTYHWRVKSHCSTGFFSGWSSETHFTTLGASCGMPFFRYTTPITDSTATFNWSAVSGALNYTVQIRLINGQWQDIIGSPTSATSITATGLLPNTMYEWRMQVNCGNGAYSIWLTPLTITTGITNGCKTPTGLFADEVTLNSANLHWIPVVTAISYSVEIRALPSGAWNPVSGSPVDTNFIFVDGLNPFASYEFRVRTNCEGGNHSFASGAVQFTTTNLPPCNPPGGLSSGSLTETTARFSWTPVAGAQGYMVQTRLPGGIWLDLAGGVVIDTNVLATGFTPNTTYEWRVRTQCDTSHFSNWSAASIFTTLGTGPGNNDCINAMLLTVETSCVSTFASNVDASASSPPPAGGCWSNGYKDVWFKFTMPDIANPTVTIRTSAGSLGNAVMEVYSGTDCSILSLIACEDNNDNANGSTMPVINLTGTANATIWIRVWGFDGSTGTFTICVFNYISFNYAGALDAEVPDEGESIDDPEVVVQAEIELDDVPEMRISPNPVNEQLNVIVRQTEESQVIGYRIMDFSGKMMLSQDIDPVFENQFRSTVDVSTLVPGMYVMQVQTTRGMLAEKLTVVR